jgi:hypothetical protein
VVVAPNNTPFSVIITVINENKPRNINPIKIGITDPLNWLDTKYPNTLDTAVVKNPYKALAVPALSP